IGGASSETAVVARVNTTYWGLLKQPDNQKTRTRADTFDSQYDLRVLEEFRSSVPRPADKFRLI
ncbi:MAG: hypothetical protein WCF26_24285, partial [Candidatus Sulfotelmatobacter sp.]